jgi:hypothetical protein
MDFLESLMTKEELKVKVQRVYKASMKLRDTNQIRDMYSETVYQLLGHLINDVKDKKEKESFEENNKKTTDTIKKLKELKEYAEEHLENVGKRYNSQKPHLSDWEFRDKRYKEREYEKKMERRKQYGKEACKNTECGNRKRTDTSKAATEDKCYGCWSSDLRIKRENRRRELIRQGVTGHYKIETMLRNEGLME